MTTEKKGCGYTMRAIGMNAVRSICEEHHGYGSAGNCVVYAWGVFEDDRLVAAYAWQPPAPGAARAVCPEAPQGVLALARMVAVPRELRRLNHVSRPLRRQMRRLIDRTRWPVLITYSDEGQGHTGHVYKCSGWQKTTRRRQPTFADRRGARVSSYSNGKHGARDLVRTGSTFVQRWEHWACARGQAHEWMIANGWRRMPVPGKIWRSGNQAYTYVHDSGDIA